MIHIYIPKKKTELKSETAQTENYMAKMLNAKIRQNGITISSKQGKVIIRDKNEEEIWSL